MTRAAGGWRRLSGWAAKKDREARKEDWAPEGLDLAEEPIRSELFQRAFRKRHLLNPPVIVRSASFSKNGWIPPGVVTISSRPVDRPTFWNA